MPEQNHKLSDARASEHFSWAELIYSKRAAEKGISNAPPEECLPLVRDFCTLILEKIRAKCGPVFITSGFRCGLLNALVSKDPNSDHIWTADRCAADIQVKPGTPLETVFDWLRLESGLPFDYIILERGKAVDSELDDCIHISFCRVPRRIAQAGKTNSASGFTRMEVV